MKAIVILLAGLLVLLPSLSQAETCGEYVKTEAQKLGLDRENFRGMRFFERRGPLGGLRGYDVWVRFHSCPGRLVVVTNRWCQVERHYWEGKCREGAQSTE